MPKQPLALILASGSPRRRAILRRERFVFKVRVPRIPERLKAKLGLHEALKQLALEKAKAAERGLDLARPHLILSADTVVVLGKKILGKPSSRAEAHRMLSELSGRKHAVKTVFCLLPKNMQATKPVLKVVTSWVWFSKISDEKIEWYLKTKEPFGKAGAYAVQGKARRFVTKIQGDFDNIVGLPVNSVKIELKKKKWHVGKR